MWPYLRQVAGLLTIGSIAGIAMNTAVVLPAILLGRAIDVAVAVDRGTASTTDLARAALLVVAGALATEVPRIGKRWWLGVARARIRATVRSDALRGVLAWPADRLHRTPIGEVMARIIGDVEVLGTGLGEIIVETWDTLLFSASLVFVMCLYDLRLAAVALVPVPIALMLAKASGRWVTARTLKTRQANAAVTGYISERITGLRTIRAFGRTEVATRELARLADRQADAELAATAVNAWLQPVYATLTVSGVVAVVWLGGDLVAEGALSIGAMVAFLQLFLRFTARAYRAFPRWPTGYRPRGRHTPASLSYSLRRYPVRAVRRGAAAPSPRLGPPCRPDARSRDRQRSGYARLTSPTRARPNSHCGM
jgi:ABC-type multidrug transport system fused ATPase/permease subunit